MAQTEKYGLYVVGAGEDPYVKDFVEQLCGETASNMTIIDEELDKLSEGFSELKISVSEGKALIASAVTDKGVETADDATFETLAANISAISDGVDVSGVTATAKDVRDTTYFVDNDGVLTKGSMPYSQVHSNYEIDKSSGQLTVVTYATEGYLPDLSDQSNVHSMIVGTLPTIEGGIITPSTEDLFYFGGSYVTGDYLIISGDKNLVGENIKSGVTIFNVEGTLEEGVDTSDASATASDILLGKTAYVNGKKITGAIETKNSDNLTADGYSVVVTPGYYPSFSSKNVQRASQAVPVIAITNRENGSALVVAEATQEEGYVSAGTRSDSIYIAPDAAYDISSTGILSIMPVEKANAIYGNEIKVNIANEESNLIAENIRSGVTIFGVSGTLEEGIDTSDATATALDMAKGVTAYVNGTKVTGDVYTRNSDDSAYGYNGQTPEIFGNGELGMQATVGGSGILYKGGSKMFVSSPLSNFGDAAAADVPVGKTFTSSSGLKVSGTVIERNESSITTNDSSIIIPAGLYRTDVTKTISGETASEWTYVYFSSDSSHPSDDIVASVTHDFNDGSGMSRAFEINLTKEFSEAKLLYAAGISEDASKQSFYVCPSMEEYTGVDYEGMYYDDDSGDMCPIIDVAYNDLGILKKISVDIGIGGSNDVLLVDALYGYLAVRF